MSKLRTEVIKSIQGEGAYSQEFLAGLVNETDEEIISRSELYDSASLEAKKMIVNAMITRIDVYNGYEPNVEFNFNIRQFFEGIAEEESEAEKNAALPKIA